MDAVVRAGFWRRLAAYLIDSIILNAVVLLFVLFTGLLGYFIGAVAAILYVTVFWAALGATPGKLALGIRIVVPGREERSGIGAGRAIARLFGYVLSAFPLGLGFLWAAWDTDKQAWHDKLTGTMVLVDQKRVKEAAVLSSSGIPMLSQAERGEDARAWPLLLLPLVCLLAFIWIPMFQLIRLSFSETRIFGTDTVFVGFKNYARLFGDPIFWKSLGNSFFLTLTGSSGLWVTLVGLGIAFLLSRAKLGAEIGVRRALSLLIICGSSLVMAEIFRGWFLSPRGFIPQLLGNSGIQVRADDPRYMFRALDIVMTVETAAIAIPLGVALFAALFRGSTGGQAISEPGHAAAKILIGAAAILVTIAAFSLSGFTTVWALTGGGPASMTMVLPVAAYQSAYMRMQFGSGAAYGVLLMIPLFCWGILIWVMAKFSGAAIYLHDGGPTNARPDQPQIGPRVLAWIGIVIFCLFLLFMCITPLLFTIFNSFKATSQLMESPFTLWPKMFMPDNYSRVLGDLGFLSALFRPLLYIIPSLVLQLGVSLLGGYALGRFRFVGREVVFLLVCATMFIGPSEVSLSLFLTSVNIHINNTYVPLIFAWAGCPLGIFMFTLFFNGRRIDAARLALAADDPARRSIRDKLVPDAICMAVFTAIVLLIRMMNDTIVPLIFINRASLFPLGVRIAQLANSMSTNLGIQNAAFTLGLIPPLILAVSFLLLQKRFFTRMQIFMPGLGGTSKKEQ
jgi:ABC-type glycerol-3-phosphate transport system permease component